MAELAAGAPAGPTDAEIARARGIAMVTLLLTGLLYVPLGALAGAVYGLLFPLDPGWFSWAGWSLGGLTVVTFAAAGAIVLMISAAVAYGLSQREEWGLWGAVALAVLFLLTGLLPSVAALAYALPTVRAGLPSAPPTPGPAPR